MDSKVAVTTGATISLARAGYGGKVDSPSIEHVGECYGGEASADISQHLDPDVILTLTIWCSNDAGKNWKAMVSASRHGGVTLNPATNIPETRMSVIGWTTPLSHGKDPLVKTTIELSKGTLVTDVTAVSFASVPNSKADALAQGIDSAG